MLERPGPPSDGFLPELCRVLFRLSPEGRRRAISTSLSQAQRERLEAWMLARQVCPETTEAAAAPPQQPPVSAGPSRRCALGSGLGKARGCGIKVHAQTRRGGQCARWYSASIWLEGLYMVARRVAEGREWFPDPIASWKT
ncbi:unnamed protein product, partial [Prorocentrum cordatum]